MRAGLIGLYQALVLHLPRANGFTNAIQYGGLSLLLGLMCSVALLVLWDRWKPWQRAGWAVGILLGLEGSLLSESRGAGWCCPWRCCCASGSRGAPASPQGHCRCRAGCVGAVGLMAFKANEVRLRVDEARQEITQYESRAMRPVRSVSAWRTGAWPGAWAGPTLTGWGRYGYEAEKQRRVDAGETHPFFAVQPRPQRAAGHLCQARHPRRGGLCWFLWGAAGAVLAHAAPRVPRGCGCARC